MDFIWSPWRYDYLASGGQKPQTCVFCVTDDRTHDADRLIVFRGTYNFIILNLFPYTSGHVNDWLKVKNPSAPAVRREAEEDWSGKRKTRQ